MKKRVKIFSVLLIGLLVAFPLMAEECPEIDSSLRFTLHKEFPSYEIAVFDSLSEQDQRKVNELSGDKCSYFIAVAPSVYVLVLKAKLSPEFLAVIAMHPVQGGSGEWLVEKLDAYDNDLPVLSKASGGFYSDVTTMKNLTVTRSSKAARVDCLDSGSQYIYKILNDGGFQRCRTR